MGYSTYYPQKWHNSVTPFPIEEGLNFILGHFEMPLFPRKISTNATKNSQILVFNKEEVLARFQAASFLDCKINAYPDYTGWKSINRQAPNFIFIDLDLGRLGPKELNKALEQTLQNIRDKLGGYPTVIWSGHGYHIYLPVEAFVLEEISEFAKFDQPSRRLIQFTEQYLSNKKSDPCHSFTMSFKNCMLRVPGSYNSKNERKIEVSIIQKWDGFRPSIKPLLYDLCLYLQDLKLKRILVQHQHPPGEFCKYWSRK
jgi:hypothetical protein